MTVEFYSDVNKRTPLTKSRITNEESIKNSVSNALNLRGKDILFEYSEEPPESYLFELINSANEFTLKNKIITILQQEPRIEVDYRLTKVTGDIKLGGYIVDLAYRIKGVKTLITQKFKV